MSTGWRQYLRWKRRQVPEEPIGQTQDDGRKEYMIMMALDVMVTAR